MERKKTSREEHRAKKKQLKRQFNIHHCYCQARWWITSNTNCKILNVLEHNNRHRVFVDDTCVEQLCKVLLMNANVRTDSFKKDIIDVLENHINNFYKKWVRSWTDKKEIETVMALKSKLLEW